MVNPKYTCFIDVGTIPAPDALLNFVKCMENNTNIAGVTGSIDVYFDKEQRKTTR